MKQEMRMRLSMILAATGVLVLASCGNSPLFHHLDAPIPSDTGGHGMAPINGCPLDFSQAGLCAAINWVKHPTADQAGTFTLSFWPKKGGSANGPYVDPSLPVAVQLWMPSMGHGSAPVTITRKQTGVYQVDNVFFIMPGQWDIRVQFKSNGQVVEQAVLPYTA